MKIGLIGYGKMGKAIERIALSRGHEIVFKANSENPFETITNTSADVAIEFTQPHLATKHIRHSLSLNLPIVVGTTAWQNELSDISKEVVAKNGSLLYASNFSVGVNIFFQLNEHLAKLMSNQAEYIASVEEVHHVQKLDAPSGTAVTLAEGLIQNHENYTSYISETGKAPKGTINELAITAFREPNVPGTHTIRYDSEIDSIEMTHTAHSRDGFALGSVLAAEFLYNKKGIFTMRDVLKF